MREPRHTGGALCRGVAGAVICTCTSRGVQQNRAEQFEAVEKRVLENIYDMPGPTAKDNNQICYYLPQTSFRQCKIFAC